MKEARFLYKCRLCGKIDDSLCTAEKNAMRILTEAVVLGKSMSGGGLTVDMVSAHCCDDDSMGVTDLIGFDTVEV
jgi:hypothetical protein